MNGSRRRRRPTALSPHSIEADLLPRQLYPGDGRDSSSSSIDDVRTPPAAAAAVLYEPRRDPLLLPPPPVIDDLRPNLRSEKKDASCGNISDMMHSVNRVYIHHNVERRRPRTAWSGVSQVCGCNSSLDPFLVPTILLSVTVQFRLQQPHHHHHRIVEQPEYLSRSCRVIVSLAVIHTSFTTYCSIPRTDHLHCISRTLRYSYCGVSADLHCVQEKSNPLYTLS